MKHFYWVLMAAIVGAWVPAVSAAPLSVSADGVWETYTSAAKGQPDWVKVDKGQTVRLNIAAFEQDFKRIRKEATPTATPLDEVSFPMPDGSFARFRIIESPVMAPELAAKFPEIKTYRGVGIDDPTASVRLDWTPAGFHAQILSPLGAVYIDPQFRGDNQWHTSYYKRDYTKKADGWSCLLLDAGAKAFAPPGGANAASTGPTLRIFRLACAATGEYTAYHGGTVAAGQAAIVTAINRVTGVYEIEFGYRLVLVANNSLLVYTNGATDPYSNNSGSTMLGENVTNLNAIIGSANYDIGHVFSTGGGGVAYLGCVCSSSKAGGVTGLSAPTGDSFWIDYVAHEMGHQFGGPHTFNSSTGSCSGNRSASSAYEPGSGTTIQAYAGICGSDNVQAHSDPYFLFSSYDSITSYINASGNCSSNVATGNSAPTVNAGANYIIPASTPFILTASGSDPNGDPLTYCWEQRDLGATQLLTDPDNGSSPLFRSFNPTTNTTRTFPKLSAILAGTSSLGERLPTTTRTMNFRCTVRDNRANGGGVNSADMQVNVVSNAGPFVVTYPNSSVTVTGSVVVAWNVAGTTNAPINTTGVNILLSTNGGNSFNFLLASNTPNDGIETVVLPPISNNTARIKIEGTGNIFFDISDTNFNIRSGTPTPIIVGAGSTLTVESCPPGNGAIDPGETVTIQFAIQNIGFTNTVNLVATLLATNGVTPITAPQTYGVLTNGGPAVSRNFTFIPNGTCGDLVSVVLQLQDGTNNYGSINTTFPLGTPGGLITNNYSSGGVAALIPDFVNPNNGQVDVPIIVAATGNISNVVAKVRLNHTYDQDLVISLIHPDGTTVILANKRGSSSDNFGSGNTNCTGTFTVFSDAAATAVSAGAAPFAGSFQPESPLAVFNGKSQTGTWILRVTDTVGGDVGYVYCAQLDIAQSSGYVCCSGSPAGNNAFLANLVPSAGTLTPAFTLTTTNYTVAVAFPITSLTVTPTAVDTNATITVNGSNVLSGTASAPISLIIGTNVISTLVVSSNAAVSNLYTLTVTRAVGSSNAWLTNLVANTGALTPAFTSNTFTYTASVPYATNSISVTPTAADSTAVITVNGTNVTSGSPSGSIGLAVGTNLISARVVSENSTVTNTYNLTVTRAVAGTNAFLANLVSSGGTINPTFASTNFNYTNSVPFGTGSLTVTPTAADTNAVIRVNGTRVASGAASGAIAVNVGTNLITITAAAEDLSATNTYLLTVVRAASVSRWWDGGDVDIAAVGNQVSAGGNGTWDTTIQNWDQGNGEVHVAWDNAAGNIAIFGGTGGTVTNTVNITVGGLIFTNAYTLTNAPGTSLAFATAGTISNSAAVTITPPLTGIGPITKAGAGTLTLTANSLFSGGLVVNAGMLRVAGTHSFTGGVIFNGGVWGDTTTWATAAALNNNSIMVATNATAGFKAGNGETFSSSVAITINSGATLDLGPGQQANSTVTYNGLVSGTGTLDTGNINQVNTITLGNTGNTNFTGNVLFRNGQNLTLNVSSFGDGGKVTYNHANGSSGIFNLASGATAPLTFNTRQFVMTGSAGGTLQLANNSAYPFTINTALDASTLTGARTLTLAGTGAGLSTFGGRIANGSNNVAVSVSKSGSGTWTLSGTNAFSGGLTLSAGTLNINSPTAIGSGTFTIGAATFDNTSGNAITNSLNGPLALNGDFFFSGNNSLHLGTGLATMGGNRNIAIYGSTLTIGGPISGAGFRIQKTGAGSLALTGLNTFTATNILQQGDWTVNTLRDYGVACSLGAAPGGIMQLGAGANFSSLTYIGAGDSCNRSFQIGDGTAANAGGVSLVSSGSGALVFTAANFNPTVPGITATRTLTLDGAYTGGTNQIQGVIQDNVANTGKISLTKVGPGIWALGGTNTYTGTTTVSNGTLLVNGQLALASAVTVYAGGTFGGTGTVGNVTVSNAAILAPGPSTAVLTVSNLALAGLYQVEIGGGSADQIVALGTVNLTAATLGLNIPPATTGNYTIINKTSAGAVTGNFTGWAAGVTNLVNGLNYTISYTGGDGNDVVLIYAGNPTNAFLANLVPSASTLTPAFASNRFSYTVAVPFATNTITLTPTAADIGPSIRVNDSLVASGTPSAAISLNVGTNLISVTVISQNATITNTYIVAVTRAPATPTGLTAVGGPAQITLNWLAATGATGYNLKRSTNSGGPYTTIQSSAVTNATDSAVVLGPTYYYVVSSVNGVLESADSAPASATLVLQPPVWRSSGPFTNDSMLLSFSGPNGQSYQLLTTTNIILPSSNWSVLQTGIFGASPVSYTHTNALNPQQFYRIKSP